VHGFFGQISFGQKVGRSDGLPQWAEVVNDPKRAPLSGSDQVPVFNGQVGDGHDGQILLKFLPISAVGDAEVHAALRPCVQNARSFRIGPYRPGEIFIANAIVDARPCFAVVLGFEKIGPVVTVFVACAGDVTASIGVRVWLYAVDHRPCGHG
jgi:hypothetical protein